jgi:uncharacterized membrane protein YagU involved in acid resistance
MFWAQPVLLVAFTSVEKHQIFLGSENKARCYTVFIHFIIYAILFAFAFAFLASCCQLPIRIGLLR